MTAFKDARVSKNIVRAARTGKRLSSSSNNNNFYYS